MTPVVFQTEMKRTGLTVPQMAGLICRVLNSERRLVGEKATTNQPSLLYNRPGNRPG